MKIKVTKNAYYVTEDLTNFGMVDQETLDNSFSHLLVVGDVWESIDNEEGNFSEQFFKCIEGAWEGEVNDGWWDYKGFEGYFEII
jgi:hypothetical protein